MHLIKLLRMRGPLPTDVNWRVFNVWASLRKFMRENVRGNDCENVRENDC